MKVDRAAFLVLTSAIFAACATKPEPSPPQPGEPVAIPVQPPPPASTSPRSDPKVEGAPPDAGKAKDVPVATDDDDEEPYKPWPGTANPPMAKTVHPQACDVTDNAKGLRAVTCTLKPGPGPSCESFGETRGDCPKLSRFLVPKVAEKAAACLNAKSGKADICLLNIGPSCVIESLSSVCLDPTPKLEQACAKVMTKCKALDKEYRHMTLDACKAAMSAMFPAAGNKFLHCAAESCDLVPCIYAAQR